MVDVALHSVGSLPEEAIVSDLLTDVGAHPPDTMAMKAIADVVHLLILHVETTTKTTLVVLPHRGTRNSMLVGPSPTHVRQVHVELEATDTVVATVVAMMSDVIESWDLVVISIPSPR